MPEITPPAAPVAAVPPVAPVVTPPAAPVVTPPAEPAKNDKLLSTLLGLVEPEKVDVRPPEAKPVVTPAAAPAPVEPEKKAVIVVKKKEAPAAPVASGPSTEDVRRIAAEEAAKARPVINTPTPAPDDSDLTPEQKEELDLAVFAEAKDPAKKGLSAKFREFYKAEKALLEKRLESEGEGYDPAQDPEYKKFVARAEPKLTSAERKQLNAERVATAAEERAMRAAEAKFKPEIDSLRQKTLELEHAPKIAERAGKYAQEVSAEMPEEIVKHFTDNGRDFEKTRAAYPGEFEIVASTINGAKHLSEEVLSLRRGLKKFDPTNGSHKFLAEFTEKQAEALLKQPAEAQMRDGRKFVHPYEWKPELAKTHWSFDDEDLLGMLKVAAGKEAKDRISSERAKLKAANEAVAKRTAAPVGATPVVAAAPAVAPVSSRTPPAPTPGTASLPDKPKTSLSSLLNL